MNKLDIPNQVHEESIVKYLADNNLPATWINSILTKCDYTINSRNRKLFNIDSVVSVISKMKHEPNCT